MESIRNSRGGSRARSLSSIHQNLLNFMRCCGQTYQIICWRPLRFGPPMENPGSTKGALSFATIPSLFKLKLPCSNLQFRNCLFTTWLKLSRQNTQYSHLLINYKFDNFLQKEMTFHKFESPVIINCSKMDSKLLRSGKSILEILEKGFFELPF